MATSLQRTVDRGVLARTGALVGVCTVALTAAFGAVGQPIPPHVVVFTIPLANLAGATPLPGGLGGIEAAYVALLVPTTGVAAATVTAAVLVFRGATYWMPVVLGGIVTAAFGVSAVRAD